MKIVDLGNPFVPKEAEERINKAFDELRGLKNQEDVESVRMRDIQFLDLRYAVIDYSIYPPEDEDEETEKLRQEYDRAMSLISAL